MQLVDQACLQILPDGRYAPTNADVVLARRRPRLLQRGMNASGDKLKFRASRHPERRPRVMGEHENGRMVRRLIPPPALPAIIRPRASDGTEHVSAENPRPESCKPPLGDVVVDAGLAISLSVHPLPGTRVKKPLHQLRTIDAERILQILARPGTVAVD